MVSWRIIHDLTCHLYTAFQPIQSLFVIDLDLEVDHESMSNISHEETDDEHPDDDIVSQSDHGSPHPSDSSSTEKDDTCTPIRNMELCLSIVLINVWLFVVAAHVSRHASEASINSQKLTHTSSGRLRRIVSICEDPVLVSELKELQLPANLTDADGFTAPQSADRPEIGERNFSELTAEAADETPKVSTPVGGYDLTPVASFANLQNLPTFKPRALKDTRNVRPKPSEAQVAELREQLAKHVAAVDAALLREDFEAAKANQVHVDSIKLQLQELGLSD
jgi:hypothetical protein